MSNQDCRRDRLETILRDLDVKFDVLSPKDVPEVSEHILVILDYSPHHGKKGCSLAFPLEDYYVGNPMPHKCWISWEYIKPIEGNAPKYHLNYRKFTYKTILFHPYSVDFSQYGLSDIPKVKCLLNTLYEHLDWGQ